MVVSAGPWLGGLLADVGLELPLAPAVAQVTFVALPSLDDRPGVADWQIDEHGVGVYGHPVPGVGYKVAFDAGSADPWDPDDRASGRPTRSRPRHWRDGWRLGCRPRRRTWSGTSGTRGR